MTTKDREAWQRWVPIWHALSLGAIMLATLLALLNSDRRTLIVGLASLFFLWYALGVRWHPNIWRQHPRRAALYVLLGIALWAALAHINRSFFLMLSMMYPFLFMYVQVPWSALLAILTATLSAIIITDLSGSSFEWVIILLVSALGGGVLALFISDVIRQSEERQRLISLLEETQRELAEVERETGILQERQRLAHEIHDTLAQGFTSIILHLNTLEATLPPELGAHPHLTQAREQARTSLAESRRFMQGLRPEVLECQPFTTGLHKAVEIWSAANPINTEFTVTGDPQPLPEELEIVLLRVTQEALSNVRKHAAAHRVRITLSFLLDHICLDVCDDGIGFDPHQTAPAGFGLMGMRERVTQAGGTLEIESAAGQGTVLAVTLPVNAGAHKI